ncbi:MAG: endonuclease/exonuclease/phosphatase family protein [Saprospiraceae bacterium]|nr:endonuclease/exonuclease/phosphatase family protein [Saprospiraceae bacterium]
MKWFFRTLIILNILVALFTTGGYLASYLHPERSTVIQSIGLFMPWLLLGNIVFFFFWITMRRKWWWLSLSVLLLGISQIGRFVGFHFKQETHSDQFIVCSYNSKSYNESNRLETFLDEINGQFDINILCLQEISENHLPLLKNSSNLKHTHFHRGKMILTNYPIVAQGNLQFDNSVNGCLWVDLKSGEDIMRVYNVHLHSNRITREAETIMNNIYSDKAQAWTKIRHMVANYQLASVERTTQVIKILEHVDACQYPVLLVGDLNDTPFSYTYQQFSDRFQDVFRIKGLGFGSTYAGALPGLKIDYIFVDERFEALSHQILRTKISDHFPVLSFLKLKD